jgi:prophage maintenance system killer protein
MPALLELERPVDAPLSPPTDINQSVKDRPDDLDRLRSFTRLSGLEVDDPVDRAAAFKDTSPEDILETLANMNDLLRGVDKFQRVGKSALSGSVVGSINPTMPRELVPPDNPTESFLHKIKEIQDTTEPTQASLDRAAVGLFFSVVGSHMFSDGNGRTARASYHLLKNGRFPADEDILDRSKTNASNLSESVNEKATMSLMLKAGLPMDRIRVSEFKGDDTADDTIVYGLTQHLKYIAIRRLRQQEGLLDPNSDSPPSKYSVDQQSEAVKSGFKDAYAAVRDEWYEEFVNMPMRNPEFCAGQIEGKSK